MRFFSSRRGGGESPLDRAIGRHIKPEHIAQMLELARLREQNIHTEATDRQKTQPRLALSLIGGVLVFTLLFGWLAFHYGKSEVILPVLTGIGGLVSGAAGGYGFGRSQATKDAKRPHDPPPVA